MFYTVVLLDGKELQDLTLEQVKDLFFRRQINQDSLIFSAESPSWQMLRRAFNLNQWIPSATPQAPTANSYQNLQPQNNPFGQASPSNQPNQQNQSGNNPFQQSRQSSQAVTFNQFPPDQPANPKNPYAQNASNGYSQNNQTETYYQAETNQTNYSFENKQANFTPSKYNNPANNYQYSPAAAGHSETRNGTKPAAVFLIVNAIFYVVYMMFGAVTPAADGGGDSAYKAGSLTGSFVPVIIDLILALKLWKLDDSESARKWCLARSYFGFAVFGFILPVVYFGQGETFVGAFSIVSSFFYFISLATVLHGKENPSPSRVMIGMGTFAIYFLIMFGTISLALVGTFAPNLAKFEMPSRSEFEKYKVEGKEFQDKTTGAKVVLPEGWSMIRLDNPVIHTPEARMIAIDQAGNRLTMLEVVPVPGTLDMKRQNSAFILGQLADNVVQSLKQQVENGDSYLSKNSFKEITRLNIYIGTHPAILLVFDKKEEGMNAKGHLIITYDELTFYVLHSWCPTEEYDKAQTDFTFFEKNFTVPEKINSPFNQSAETKKTNANSKKNF
jgi:hypothetical protein